MTNEPLYGLPTGRIEHGELVLDYLTTVGPRVVRLSFAGSENLLAELPGVSLPSPHGEYTLYGGHRLWAAPESPQFTYVPDDSPIEIETVMNGVSLRKPKEHATGLVKSIVIERVAQKPAFRLRHCIQNQSETTVRLAPWAITQMRLGGKVFLPQQSTPVDDGGYLPNRNLNLWLYTHFQDERIILQDDWIIFHAQASSPCKIGYLNRHGWLAYWIGELLFVKQFTPFPDQLHPDGNSNTEVYGNDAFVELETVAPWVDLAPYDEVSHDEIWTVISVPNATEDIILAHLKNMETI